MNNFGYKLANILIVEDNEWDRLVAETLLKKDFNVHAVASANETLTAINNHHYDIILMDINLGEHSMDGMDLMKQIKSNPKFEDIKIFAVTAYSEDPDHFLSEGFDEIYVKPVIKEEMTEAIFRALKNVRQRFDFPKQAVVVKNQR